MKFLLFAVFIIFVYSQHTIYWVGNSYSMGNDLPNSLRMLAKEGLNIDLQIQRQLRGGFTLKQHSEIVGVRESLQRPWKYVILQDHSMHPGLIPRRNETKGMLTSFYIPALLTHKPEIILYQTWGRRLGLSGVPQFPNYKQMQKLTIEGYDEYKTLLERSGLKTSISQTGVAWESIFDEIIRSGKNPLDKDSMFSKLYLSDDSHPTETGSYLNACVFYKRIFNKSPVGLKWAPSNITNVVRDYLQKVAERIN